MMIIVSAATAMRGERRSQKRRGVILGFLFDWDNEDERLRHGMRRTIL